MPVSGIHFPMTDTHGFLFYSEEAALSFKRQSEQWTLLLLLSFYLQSVGNLSERLSTSTTHRNAQTNHRITGCSAEELSVLPLGTGHCI